MPAIPTATPPGLKASQQATWASGDYNRIAWLTVPLADILVDAVDLRPSSRVLDVATGTGHVALAAARRFSTAVGVDYVPALVDVARERARAEDLDVTFQVGDAEDLSAGDASFDYVLSAIGVMFTADHQRAADELVRVCAPEGRIGLLSWTPGGFVGQLLRTVGQYVPPPPGALPPIRWGSRDVLTELFADQVTGWQFSTGTISMRFRSPEQFADHFLAHYGPTLRAAQRLPQEDWPGFRAALASLIAGSGLLEDGTVRSEWEYLVAVADRAG
ncbi:class I SAM-dependent methyltransferase [Ruania alba]|uniref:Methyltransferase domain-containing protein n=1 Tax=Ruania alba TaxID=648782 RepID=A0A1H5MPJ5_9MICO|nr:class I SAM-dependent methyltransferase [Ruania alba]SEE91234.1 Methyltransferase domain-containing protein [Ruania alba]